MNLPRKNTLKAAFVAAVAGIGLTGCAVVPYERGPYRHAYIEPAPIIIVPQHHHHFEPPRHAPRHFYPRHHH